MYHGYVSIFTTLASFLLVFDKGRIKKKIKTSFITLTEAMGTVDDFPVLTKAKQQNERILHSF